MMSSDALSPASSISGLPRDIRNPSPQLQQQQQQRQQPALVKEKRKLPGTPDPDAEVIAMSPGTLMATNRFVCEVCKKGFQREQNLQLHRRGHNLPWKLKERTGKDQVARKRVFVCPEKTCVHHHPSRALGDLTGIKKHFSRKHGEKKWKCERCSKAYAVMCDWKAHAKVCGTREYTCDCGAAFSRKDSFTTHRAFCDALLESSARLSCSTTTTLATAAASGAGLGLRSAAYHHNADGDPRLGFGHDLDLPGSIPQFHRVPGPSYELGGAAFVGFPHLLQMGPEEYSFGSSHVAYYGGCSALPQTGAALSLSNSSAYGRREEEETAQQLVEHYTQSENTSHLSATAQLQKAAQIEASTSNKFSFSTSSSSSSSLLLLGGYGGLMSSAKSFDNGRKIKNERQGRQLDTSLLPGQMLGGEESLTEMASTAGGMMMMMASPGHDKPLLKSSETNTWEHEVGLGLTKDFLGLGGDETTQRPFPKQGLGGFASMVPGMDLTSSRCDGQQ